MVARPSATRRVSRCPHFRGEVSRQTRSGVRHPVRSRGTDGAQGLTARQRAAESDAKATVARSDERARVSGRVVGVPALSTRARGIEGRAARLRAASEIGTVVGSRGPSLFRCA